MSYYTRVEFHFADEPPSFDIVEACAREHFDAEHYGVDDIVATLRRGCDKGVAEFNRMESSDFEGFMLRLSQRLPECRMCVRGSGEEWRDYWMREFEGGKVAFTAGPFIEGKKPAFFRFFFGDKMPNKALEPTSTSVTLRAIVPSSKMKLWTETRLAARIVPAVVVAHL